jgi:hypothetical protein
MATKPNNGLQADSGFAAQPIARQAECVSAYDCHLPVPPLPLNPTVRQTVSPRQRIVVLRYSVSYCEQVFRVDTAAALKGNIAKENS